MLILILFALMFIMFGLWVALFAIVSPSITLPTMLGNFVYSAGEKAGQFIHAGGVTWSQVSWILSAGNMVLAFLAAVTVIWCVRHPIRGLILLGAAVIWKATIG